MFIEGEVGTRLTWKCDVEQVWQQQVPRNEEVGLSISSGKDSITKATHIAQIHLKITDGVCKCTYCIYG